ncbi:hypothetical protein E4T43_01865 [Aureobasidium subglaciale]|nr:hypothetical protein E4T43_01865 [Aureobasidium subglaciale]
MSVSLTADLPRYEPSIAELAGVHGSEFLPFVLYNLAGIPGEDLERLLKTLNKENTIGLGTNAIRLVCPTPTSSPQSKTLGEVLTTHVRYCTTHLKDLDCFPFGFLTVLDEGWKNDGLFLVHIDFEEPFEVTGFRLSLNDVPTAASTLRDDDHGTKEVRQLYECRN